MSPRRSGNRAYICIFVPEADGLNVFIAVFGVNWYFARRSPFVVNTLEDSRERCRYPRCRRRLWPSHLSNKSCWACRSKNTLNQPRRNAGKWWSQSECGVWNVVARDSNWSNELGSILKFAYNFQVRQEWGKSGVVRRGGNERRHGGWGGGRMRE